MKWLARKKKTDETALPMLSTERLVLRAFDMNDAVHVYAFAQSDKVGPMAGFKPHTSLEDSRAMVKKFIESGEVWAIVDKSTGRVIGFISLQADGRRSMESAKRMGYVLGEADWGRGYATEACLKSRPESRYVSDTHIVACHAYDDPNFKLNGGEEA